MTAVSIDHIVLDDKGRACIAGTRARVTQIVRDVRTGLTPDQIHEEYPHLSLAQIHAALSFYFDHQADVDAKIEEEDRFVEQMRAAAGPSPVAARLRAEGKLK
jgi:uncharacterized protein (DUF433 family)